MNAFCNSLHFLGLMDTLLCFFKEPMSKGKKLSKLKFSQPSFLFSCSIHNICLIQCVVNYAFVFVCVCAWGGNETVLFCRFRMKRYWCILGHWPNETLFIIMFTYSIPLKTKQKPNNNTAHYVPSLLRSYSLRKPDLNINALVEYEYNNQARQSAHNVYSDARQRWNMSRMCQLAWQSAYYCVLNFRFLSLFVRSF